ncbi:hypothetical protein DM860_014025 [Cuscuta australis]|uniref:Phytocyanin domain-containing protein n=1 Tax=Cuscuta australis TaxID=267555 RepID=A0A328DSL8_9ASTE|nr:hypothetical protein DM860_014025 [Cuscuta australis]
MTLGWSTIAVALTCAAVVMLPGISSDPLPIRHTVGGRNFWNSNVNYTEWALKEHVYKGDWLYFVFDKTQFSVLEVNKTDYESCNSNHVLHDYTRGGRDVVQLNETKTYYFISGNGHCYGGTKVAIRVEDHPPPPKAQPAKNSSPPTFRGHILVPALFAVAALWDSLLLLM